MAGRGVIITVLRFADKRQVEKDNPMSGSSKGESGEGSEQGKRRGEGTGAKEEGQRAAKRQHMSSMSSEGTEGEEELPGESSRFRAWELW